MRNAEAGRAWLRCLCDTARLMVGQPNYEAYLEHHQRLHPDKPPMTRAEFFRDREAARYGGGGGTRGFRCC
ncbi:YbdD/YjiX family protein [Roseicella aquatilis]|uniref:YbdD/YjiX family protein n=1 Tax=Roseicella aquatilis TaxID=2527868 RepID=A0A4R4DBP8_9PROT|nr:YbdD/YjiX family protein [Roseicella aquatilis]TCZ56660.1 YbdD/YjiX family protein [Roseicella aquatilis]